MSRGETCYHQTPLLMAFSSPRISSLSFFLSVVSVCCLIRLMWRLCFRGVIIHTLPPRGPVSSINWRTGVRGAPPSPHGALVRMKCGLVSSTQWCLISAALPLTRKRGLSDPPTPIHLICLPNQRPPVELPASDGNVLGQGPQTCSINVQIVSIPGSAKRVRFLLLLLSLSLPPTPFP